MVCEECKNEFRISALETKINEFEEKNAEDHKALYDKINENEKLMIESQGDRKHIREQLNEINGNVKSLMQTPVRRYETAVTCVLTGIVGAVIGFIMSGILPM